MNKKWWSVLVGAVTTTAAVLARPKGKPAPPVVTPPAPLPSRYGVRVEVFNGDPEADDKVVSAKVTLGAVTTWTDGAGNASLLALPGLYTMAVSAPGYVDGAVSVAVPVSEPVRVSLAREVVELQPLRADGRIFRTADGQPFRWKGVSAFALLDRFTKGQDISDTLTAYKGYNVLRVWPYVPRADWGAQAWDAPGPDVTLAFLTRVEQAGFYVELTLLTDDAPGRIAWARDFLNELARAHPGNLIIEAGNEPTTHKSIDTHALKAALDASGFLYSSGDYEDSSRWFGSFLTAHTGRDGDWPRRAHDLLEFYQGGGPNAPSDPAHHVPIVADEPIRPDQAGYNAQDFRAYFGAVALLGAGGTWHCETGKFGLPPTPEEAQIAAVALDALNAFPADASLGSYRRIDEGGRSLRTYVIGERYMVRIRPTTKDAPEAGWTAIDGDGVLWKR